MQKNKDSQRLKLMNDIKAGKPVVHTTEKSAFNQAAEVNRPTYTYYVKGTRGRMLTQFEMYLLRRWEQIWPCGIQTDADSMRDFKVR